MFRLWAKLWKDTHLIQDIVIENGDGTQNRTKKVLDALDEACAAFRLSRPIWLDLNIKDFQKFDKTRFTQDSFIDAIDFDYLEIHVIEED